VFAVVENEDQRPSGQVPHDELCGRSGRLKARERGRGRPERGGGRHHPVGLGDTGQLDEPGTVGVLLAQRGGRLHREAGLARPARAGQRDEPARANRLAQLGQLGVAADKAAQPFPQVADGHRRRDRPGRRARSRAG